MGCTLYLTDFALCPLNKKLSVVFNSKKKQVCATHRETARDSVEGELSGGEQAERRRSGETTLNKVRTQIKTLHHKG